MTAFLVGILHLHRVNFTYFSGYTQGIPGIPWGILQGIPDDVINLTSSGLFGVLLHVLFSFFPKRPFGFLRGLSLEQLPFTLYLVVSVNS
jgi:hypothetical protein